MKFLIFLLMFIPSISEACINKISVENARRAIALEPGVSADPNGEVCFDGVDWETAELIELTEPVWETASNVTACEDEDACRELISKSDFCPVDYSPFYKRNESESLEAYCSKIIGQKGIGQFKLVENPGKKASKEAKLRAEAEAQKAKADARKAAVDELKGIKQKPVWNDEDRLKVLRFLLNNAIE